MSSTTALPELKLETEDDVLEKAVRTAKVQKAPGVGRRVGFGAEQSHQARAWTTNGQVD